MSSLRRLYEIGCPACEGTLEGDDMIDIGMADHGDVGMVPLVMMHSREIRTFCTGPDHHQASVHYGGGQMWTTIKKRGEPDARSAFEAIRR